MNPSLSASRDGTRNAHVNFYGRERALELKTTIVSHVNKGILVSTSAAEGLYAFSFTLDGLPDYTNYVSVWDMYRIVGIDVTVLPLTLQSAPSASNAYAFLYIAPDYDDATTPANSTAMLSYSNLAILGPSEKYSFSYIPRVAMATTTSGAASITGAMSAQSPWLDCSSSGVVHYGIKAAVTQSTSTSITGWNLFARVRVEFRKQQ